MLKFIKWVFICSLVIGGLSLGLSGINEDSNLLSLIFGDGMIYRVVLWIIGISAVGEILFWFLTARPWSCCSDKKH